jgi:hypothetical protein
MTSSKYKLTLVCGALSTTFTKPTSLPDSPNTAESDVYQMIEPLVDYTMSPGFTLTNNNCPIITQVIGDPTSGGGGTKYTYSGTPVTISTGVMDSTLNLKVPLINVLERDFEFRITATAKGGRSSTTNDIKIRRVNCYYVTISESPAVPTAMSYTVRDLGISLDTTPMVYPF